MQIAVGIPVRDCQRQSPWGVRVGSGRNAEAAQKINWQRLRRRVHFEGAVALGSSAAS